MTCFILFFFLLKSVEHFILIAVLNVGPGTMWSAKELKTISQLWGYEPIIPALWEA